MPSILSSKGNTKHADRVPCSVPAFISVGEFGKNSRLLIILKKSASVSADSTSNFIYCLSIDATDLATLVNISVGVSITLLELSFNKYL